MKRIILLFIFTLIPMQLFAAPPCTNNSNCGGTSVIDGDVAACATQTALIQSSATYSCYTTSSCCYRDCTPGATYNGAQCICNAGSYATGSTAIDTCEKCTDLTGPGAPWSNSAAGSTNPIQCSKTCTTGPVVIPGGIKNIQAGTVNYPNDCNFTITCNAGFYKDGNECKSCATETTYYTSSIFEDNANKNRCFLTLAPGKYVATPNAAPGNCPATQFCPGGMKVYYGGTGHATSCGTSYDKSDPGAQSQNDCYAKCDAGYFWNGAPGTLECQACNDLVQWHITGSYCPGTDKIPYNTRINENYGLASCTGLPSGATWTGNGTTATNCPWGDLVCTQSWYWNNSTKSCAKCKIGYFCGSDTNVTNATPDGAGLSPCPIGKTTTVTGAYDPTIFCHTGAGSNGTKFCDKNGCFNLPVVSVD